jgi:hypothetical protein
LEPARASLTEILLARSGRCGLLVRAIRLRYDELPSAVQMHAEGKNWHELVLSCRGANPSSSSRPDNNKQAPAVSPSRCHVRAAGGGPGAGGDHWWAARHHGPAGDRGRSECMASMPGHLGSNWPAPAAPAAGSHQRTDGAGGSSTHSPPRSPIRRAWGLGAGRRHEQDDIPAGTVWCARARAERSSVGSAWRRACAVRWRLLVGRHVVSGSDDIRSIQSHVDRRRQVRRPAGGPAV